MDTLTLMVLAEQKKHVQYRMPDFIEAPAQIYRAHASCFHERMEQMAPLTRDTFMESAAQIACTTGDCRWCGLPLVSRPHHFLRPPKAARLSKVVGARNMDPYKRAAATLYGVDFSSIEAMASAWLHSLPNKPFNPDIFRK